MYFIFLMEISVSRRDSFSRPLFAAQLVWVVDDHDVNAVAGGVYSITFWQMPRLQTEEIPSAPSQEDDVN